jgi:hypothetical protein
MKPEVIYLYESGSLTQSLLNQVDILPGPFVFIPLQARRD